MKFIVKTLEGLEEVMEAELKSFEAEDILILKRAVACSGNKLLMYKINLLSRTALKVLVVMKEFEIETEEDYYNEIKKEAWEEYFSLDETFAIDSVVNSEIFTHSNYMALKAKDAIVDRFRDKYGSRPNVDPKHPDLQINVHIRDRIVTLSLDSSGTSLHMRGYRRKMVDAPINEVLAAGMILISGWDQNSKLIDPMCGSATILCEAARFAMNIPPHDISRDFAFKKWKSFDNELLQMVWDEAQTKVKSVCPAMIGYDTSEKAVHAAKENIDAAGLNDYIEINNEDFFYLEGDTEATLIFNPPYDERLHEDDVMDFYKFIGDKLKHSFKGCTAWIISGHIPAIKNLGLRASAKKSLLNGSIPSVFCKYEMYAGSKKKKWQNIQNKDSSESE